MLFLSYLLFGLTAQLVIRDRVLAVIATLGLITIPQVGYEAQRDLTHTVAVLFAACMFAYFFVRALLKPTALDYALDRRRDRHRRAVEIQFRRCCR